MAIEGILPEGLTLSAEEQTPDRGVFALMQDDSGGAHRVSLKAYDITPKNADGTVWQPAKGATVKVTIPDVYTHGDNVTVNVYYLLIFGADLSTQSDAYRLCKVE